VTAGALVLSRTSPAENEAQIVGRHRNAFGKSQPVVFRELGHLFKVSDAPIRTSLSEIGIKGLVGAVTLTASTRTEVRFGRRRGSSSNVGYRFPFRHGVEAVKVGRTGRAAGAGWNEKVADGREHIDEPLQPSGRPKALPRPFSPTERQM
jgi:hypothetical protein